MTIRRLLAVAMVASAVATLAACASPADDSASFATWASGQEFVVSVDAHPESGSVSAHLVVDGAIGAPELLSLTEAAWDKAKALGLDAPMINLIVGNAWGFSIDETGSNVAVINTLRDDAAFVGATVEYEPLDETLEYSGGIRGTVGSQAALRGANDALIAAVVGAGGAIRGVPIGASTANGAFGILGEGDAQPLEAIQLWQAISGRVTITGAQATVDSSGAERLEITVANVADSAAAEEIGAQHPDVELTVALN